MMTDIQQIERDYLALFQAWNNGERGREICLHLSFSIWYLLVEGMFTELANDISTEPVKEAFERLGGRDTDDVEVLFAFGVMADIADWALGLESEPEHWAGFSEHAEAMLIGRLPKPEMFEGRGEYGKYFARHLTWHTAQD